MGLVPHQSIKKRQDEEVSKLCQLFKTMDPSVVEEVPPPPPSPPDFLAQV